MKTDFVFICAVWGADFCDTWLKTCLPLYQFGVGDQLIVITDNKEENFAKLESVFESVNVPVEIKRLPMPVFATQHDKMNLMHQWVIKEFASPSTCLVFLSPDVVYSDGSFEWMRQQIRSGKKAVVAPMFRTKRKEMVAEIDGSNSVTSSELIKIALKHKHPMTEALHWHSPIYYHWWPSHIYWEAPQGLVGHCFHQHPVAVCLDKPSQSTGTLDKDLLVQAGITIDQIAVVTNSDDFCGVELTDEKSHVPMFSMPGSGEVMDIQGNARWAKAYTTELDREFFQRQMWWHVDGRSQPAPYFQDLCAVLNEARCVCDAIVAEIPKASCIPKVQPQWLEISRAGECVARTSGFQIIVPME